MRRNAAIYAAMYLLLFAALGPPMRITGSKIVTQANPLPNALGSPLLVPSGVTHETPRGAPPAGGACVVAMEAPLCLLLPLPMFLLKRDDILV